MPLLTYVQDPDLFVRKVKFLLSAEGVKLLADLRYGRACGPRRRLAYELFSSLQVLSYLREEDCDGHTDKKAIAQVIYYVATLVDLEDVGLEPYNLALRPTHSCPETEILFHNDGQVLADTFTIQVGAGVITRALRPPRVYPAAPVLTPLTPLPL